MNNTEKKKDWMFEALRFLVRKVNSNSVINNERDCLLNNADRIIAEIETEKEEPTLQDKTKQALSDAPRD